MASVPEDSVFIGLDEDTAMMGRGSSWAVLGKSGIHVKKDDAWTTYRDGDGFELGLI